jgi:tRNA (guanine37-N1)-methyltransferase
LPRLIRTALEKAGLEPVSVTTGVDVVGDIAIVRLPGLRSREKKRFAVALLEQMSHVKCAFEQEGGIEGEYRLRKLAHLAGERRTTTLHRENGCAYKVDVAKCYFSPRLSTERLRVASQVKTKERVLNMFAGVGPFSIPIAKTAGARVTSCEINGLAASLHEENDRLNKVKELVDVVEGDAANLPDLVTGKFDRVLMPHPSQADKFLAVALTMAKKKAVIHYYRHVLGRDESEAAGVMGVELDAVLPRKSRYVLRKVREVGPRWVEMVADVRLSA